MRVRTGRLIVPFLVICFALSCVTFVQAQQTFFLDFDTFTDTGDDPKDYIYSTAERTSITDILNDKFAGLDITFTDTEPSDGSLFSTVFFNTGLSESEKIDFQNVDKSDTATMHIPKVMETAGLSSPFDSSDVIISSVNIAAHESGHLLGLRHHDSFLPPGMGVPGESFVDDFDPFYPGPTSATMTGMETMSLTTSVGFSASKLLDPELFFGPRSAVKLMMASPPVDFDVDETSGFHNAFDSPQSLDLETVELVNNLPEGTAGSELTFLADLAVVEEASLDMGSAGPESDYYAFSGFEGDLFQLEVISSILDDRLGDLLDPRISVFPATDPGADLYYGDKFNDDERESTDSVMIDLMLPEDGTYIVEVWSSPKAAAGFETGEYELYLYRFRAIPEPGSAGVCLGFLLLAGALAGRRNRRQSA